MKIGVFGGSFNPPHRMHVNIINHLLKEKWIDHAVIVPTGRSYPKGGLIEPKYRYDMLNILFSNHDQVSICDYECKNKLTYTYQTLNEIKIRYPNDEIYFILGSDNLKEFATWREYEFMLKTFQLLVILRNSDQTDVIKTYDKKYHSHIHFVPMQLDSLSSTQMRRQLESGIYNIEGMDPRILEYIKTNGLYTK